MSATIPDDAPDFSSLSPEECEVDLQGDDLFVRCDGWEYYLGEENGPCRPSLDLSCPTTTIRLYGEKAVVFHEEPEVDRGWEIGFRLRNVYPDE